MSNIIDSIQLSGTVYTIQGSGGTVSSAITSGDTNAVAGGAVYDKFDEVEQVTARAFNSLSEADEVTARALIDLNSKIEESSGGGNPTVELTQAEYDALVTAGTVSADTYYIITDAQAGDLTQYWTSAQTQSAINQATSGKVNTSSVVTAVTSGSTDSEIPTAKAVYDAIPTGGTGGGKAISAGTNISVTTGETADTVSCTLPISGDSKGIYTTTEYPFLSTSTKKGNVIFGDNNRIDTFGSSYSSTYNLFFGKNNIAYKNCSCMLWGGANNTEASPSRTTLSCCVILGYNNKIGNDYETAIGQNNVSLYSSTTFGDSGNTLFSVGNGTSNNARHNAFEIRQNGDIYISSGGTDIKLQDNLGGGGGSITIDPTLDSGSRNPVANSAITTAINAKADTTAVTQAISEAVSGKSDTTAVTQAISEAVSGKADTSAVTAVQDSLSGKADTSAVTSVQDSLSGYVTTNTKQDITGNKTFIGSSDTSKKPIIFKQANNNHKIGFSLQDPTNHELAGFELRPNTYTDSSSVSHPLLYLGHYRTNTIANAGVVQTMVGFRQYDQKGAAAYHYLMPLPAEAKTPFSLTTSFKNYFAPLGFKNGSTMITTDNTGVADFSDVLGGLKLVKLTQSAYDALTTKDDNTVYFIGDSTNGYTMKIGSANVN